MKKLILMMFLSSTAFAQAPMLPDRNVTPGVIIAHANKNVICVSGYTSTVRNVPESVKKQVFDQYNIDPKTDKFEIDHLISLELGGSNNIKNLWPQSYTTKPYNAHMKDALENQLHKLVCSGQLDLQTAQNAIASNWIEAYRKYINK